MFIRITGRQIQNVNQKSKTGNNQRLVDLQTAIAGIIQNTQRGNRLRTGESQHQTEQLSTDRQANAKQYFTQDKMQTENR